MRSYSNRRISLPDSRAGHRCLVRAVGNMLGLDIPIIPIRGQMWATTPQPPRVFSTIGSAESSFVWSKDNGADASHPPNLTHKNAQRLTRHLYGRQRKNGEVIFGGDRESLGYIRRPEQAGIDVNKRMQSRFCRCCSVFQYQESGQV